MIFLIFVSSIGLLQAEPLECPAEWTTILAETLPPETLEFYETHCSLWPQDLKTNQGPLRFVRTLNRNKSSKVAARAPGINEIAAQ